MLTLLTGGACFPLTFRPFDFEGLDLSIKLVLVHCTNVDNKSLCSGGMSSTELDHSS